MGLSTRLRLLYETSPETIRDLGGRIVGVLPPNVRYGREFAETAKAAAALRGASAARIEALQLRELRRVWGVAVERVPYYQALAASGRVPSLIDRIEDLRELPLLTKRDVRDLGDLLYDPAQDPRTYRLVTTGGTTGQPLGFRVSYAASAREWALMLESWSRVGYGSRSRRAVLRGARVEGREHGERTKRDRINRALILSGFDLSVPDLDRYTEAMRKFGADFLHAYPSTAWVLARHLARTGRVAI